MNIALATASENIKRFFGLDVASDYEEETYYEPKPKKIKEPVQPQPFFQSTQAKPESKIAKSKTQVEPEMKQNERVSFTTNDTKNVQKAPQNTKAPTSNVLSMEKNQMMKNRTNTRVVQPKAKEAEKVSKITVLEPRTYNEAKVLADSLFRNEIVIVSFRSVDESQARRIVDFLTGAVYAIDGDIQRLDSEMFICTPPNTEVDSDIAKSLIK